MDMSLIFQPGGQRKSSGQRTQVRQLEDGLMGTKMDGVKGLEVEHR